jgi:hypothetical protein
MAFLFENLGDVGGLSGTNVLVLVAFVACLTPILCGTSQPYNRFRRLGRPWFLSLFPSKPVHELVVQGYREVSRAFPSQLVKISLTGIAENKSSLKSPL